MNNPINYRFLLLVLFTFLLGLLVFMGTCKQQTEGAVKIIAGKSIGDFQLKQEIEQSRIFEILGDADSSDAAMCKSWSIWFLDEEVPEKEFDMYSVCDPDFDMRKTIKIMRLANAEFLTERGVTNHSTLKELQELLPEKFTIENLENRSSELVTLVDIESAGIAFEILDTKITAVIVHEPGQKLTDTYLPFYKNN